MKGKALTFHVLTAQLLDIATTFIAIHYLGFYEANPLASRLFNTYGMENIFLLKILMSILVIYMSLDVVKKFKELKGWVGFSLFLSLTVTWTAVLTNLSGIILAISG